MSVQDDASDALASLARVVGSARPAVILGAAVTTLAGRAAGAMPGSASAAGATSVSGARIELLSPAAGPVEFGGYPHGRPYVARGRYIMPVLFGPESSTAAEAWIGDVIAGLGLGE